MREWNSSAAALYYGIEDMSSTFIIDLPQLQKYPDSDSLLSVCVSVRVRVGVRASFNDRDKTGERMQRRAESQREATCPLQHSALLLRGL